MIDVIFDDVQSEHFQTCKKCYIFVADFCSTYYIEFRAVVIYNIFAHKCNAYILELGDGLYTCYDAMEIIQKAKPLSLEEAKKAFPADRFTKENYGF